MIKQKTIDLTDVLVSLTSKHEAAGFTIIGDGFPETEAHYNRMASFDDPSHKPTWQEVIEEYDSLVQQNENEKYAFLRAKEYPSIEDQLDTIFHEGIDVWKEQIQSIKDKYPKV